MIILLAGSASLALAYADVAADAAGEQPPPIIVTGEREGRGDVQDRPGGTDLVKAEDYADKVAVSLREALAFSPGVYAQPRFGQEVRLSIRGSGISRGFHMRGLTLLQDGIPINLADDNGDFQELDPLIFDRIEVLRGANALHFGGSTLGGAVNGITPTGLSAQGWTIRADGGSFATLRGLLSYGADETWGDAWLGITGDRSDGERDHARRRALRFNGNLGLKASEALGTRFYATLQTIDQDLPGALTYDRALASPGSGNVFGDQQRNINSLRLQNRTSFGLGRLQAEAGAFVNVKRLDHPIFQVVDQRSVDYGVFGRARWNSGALDLLAGVTARFGAMDSRRFVNVGGDRGALTFDADLRAATIDAYGEARYRLGHVTLVAAGIFTRGTRRQDQVFPAIVSGQASYDSLSPKLGLLYEPREDLQFYANVSRSHEFPGFIELAQVASFVPLAAQHAWTAEAGARGSIGAARFDVAIYRAHVKNELLQFAVGPDIPSSTFNADSTIHQGIEAGLDLDLAPWLRLRQVYQFNDFRFRNDGQFGDNRLPVIARHLYRAQLRIGTERLSVSPSLEWVPRGAWADYANTLRAGGYTMLGLTAEAEVGRGVALFIDLRNATAKRAVGDISAVVNYAVLAPAQRAIFFPLERRALFAGLRTTF